MSDTPEYRHLKGLMHQAVHAGDGDTIRKWTGAWAEELMTTAAPTGSIDVVAGLRAPDVGCCWWITIFGVPAPEGLDETLDREVSFREHLRQPVGNDPVMKKQSRGLR